MLKSNSIKFRLLLAVAALALSTLIIGLASWYWLSRSNAILEELHSTTLYEVNRSHELTKQSALFTTTAPYLLNLSSSYLVQSEGNKLLRSIDTTIESWESREVAFESNAQQSSAILKTLADMRQQIEALISQSQVLSNQDDRTRLHTAELSKLDKQLAQVLSNNLAQDQIATVRQAQLAVHKLVTASNASSLLSLGEYQREFLNLSADSHYELSPNGVQETIKKAYTLAQGPEGLFQTRFNALQHKVSAHRLLGRISAKANDLNVQVLSLIEQSEFEIARRREETTANIQYAKILVALFGIGSVVLSLLSAFYISGYIIKRLNDITTTMTGLASGDLSIGTSRNIERHDELGALQQAFNVFHANAIEHNKLHTEHIQKSALLESTFNNISDGVAITNAEGKLLALNPKLNQLLAQFGSKTEATIGCTLSEKVEAVSSGLPDSQNRAQNTAYRELRTALGHVLEIRTSLLPDNGSVWLFSDTTQRRRVEERLQHFQRLESLGQLTGEVAHDVNNVLSAVKATLPAILLRRQNESEHRLAVEQIEEAVDMGNSLTHRLLAFAKKQRLEPKYIEINELVNGVSDLISLSLGNHITLTIVNSEERLVTYIDPLQLESALLNLCMNSAHAINGYGTIALILEQSDDNRLLIHVKDDGCGMNNETLTRAVEPFYSTRRGSSGTGLGLSIVYGFVKQSGGDLQIKSTEGTGTTVTLSLQRFADESADASADELAGQTKTSNRSATPKQTVLIVEDDTDTLERAIILFESAGYQTTKANSYEAAKRMLSKNTRYSLLFTDLHLGIGQNGWALAKLCLEQHLVKQVIVASGRAADLSKPPFALSTNCKTLAKPYSAQDIFQLT